MPSPNSDQSETRNSRIATLCAVAMLVVHGALLGWVSYVNSPNLDEPAHLAAGISHWTFGRFDLYRVNPPLVRMVAAAPIMIIEAKTDWSGWNTASPYSRSEFHAGKQFVIQNGMTGFWYFTLARWACIPLCLVGVWTVFLWAKELYGTAAGLTAMFLYCFCPNMIAWGASITPDAVGASFGVLAAYTYWRWLRNPTWGKALQAGLALGLAELAKGTWIVLFVLWPIVWLVHRLANPKQQENGQAPIETTVPSSVDNGLVTKAPAPFRQLVVVLLTAIYLLNLGFGFEGSFTRLREYKFVSKTLSGQDHPPAGANRFADTWVGFLPLPLPENYVRGLDVQKCDFERGKWSYLCGEQRKGGWWYYYLFAFLVKSPIGTLTIFTASTMLAILHRRYSSGWRNELMLLLPAIVVLLLVSSQTGFSRYLRYTLPIFPFFYIHVSRIAIAFSCRQWFLSVFVIVSCLATAVESLSVFPHSMSFFNKAAGGPLNGHAYLLDANIDWGQDLLFLMRWYDNHPEARPFHLAYFGDMDVSPEAAGIIAMPVPGFLAAGVRTDGEADLPGPQPGWYAASVNHIKGYHHYETDRPQFTYFQRLQPIARAGYSIYIYQLTLDQANTLRAEIGLGRIAETD